MQCNPPASGCHFPWTSLITLHNVAKPSTLLKTIALSNYAAPVPVQAGVCVTQQATLSTCVKPAQVQQQRIAVPMLHLRHSSMQVKCTANPFAFRGCEPA